MRPIVARRIVRRRERRCTVEAFGARGVVPLVPCQTDHVDPARDRALVARQLGREPLPFLRVVARCPAGAPAAVEQPPATPAGTPFPTTFWLTCPALVRAIGRLEGNGGVAALEALIRADASAAAAFAAARRRQIALRPSGPPLGIGGTRTDATVKCLHAHAAFALGSPPYPLGESIIAAAGGFPEVCCTPCEVA